MGAPPSEYFYAFPFPHRPAFGSGPGLSFSLSFMMKIGLFGGTFDPVHNGHLIVARDAVEALGLDALHFIPNHISPHKLDLGRTSAGLRVEMLRRAIEGEPCFHLYEGELEREGVSFSIDTVLDFRRTFPGDELFYLIGEDNLPDLHTWQRIGELLELSTFVVQTRDRRSRSGIPLTPDAPQLTPAQKARLRFLPQRQIDISATEIRKRVAKRQSIRYFVPESVHDIITRHHLYTAS